MELKVTNISHFGNIFIFVFHIYASMIHDVLVITSNSTHTHTHTYMYCMCTCTTKHLHTVAKFILP